MAELYLQQPLFPGTCELDQIDKIFQVLGTPKRDQWREGYKLAEKREIVFNEYPKKNLQKYLPGVGDDALLAIKNMLKISSQKRGNASDVLALPFFKGAFTNMQTPSTQDSILGLNSPSLTVKAPKAIKQRHKSQNQQNLGILSYNSLQDSDRGNEETSNIDISNLNLHQVTESAHEGNSPVGERSQRPPQKRDEAVTDRRRETIVDKIDASALDTSLGGGQAAKMRSSSEAPDKSVKLPTNLPANVQLNQTSALSSKTTLAQQFMSTQYRYRAGKGKQAAEDAHGEHKRSLA